MKRVEYCIIYKSGMIYICKVEHLSFMLFRQIALDNNYQAIKIGSALCDILSLYTSCSLLHTVFNVMMYNHAKYCHLSLT